VVWVLCFFFTDEEKKGKWYIWLFVIDIGNQLLFLINF
jgi:hypothetical protein